jgi:hypothetical protein
MSNPTYACVIPGCKETRVYTHYLNHIFQHKLSEFPANLVNSLKLGIRGSLLTLSPKVSGFESKFAIKGCLGCKKMYQKIGLQIHHQATCPNKEKHKAACKAFLGEVSEVTQENNSELEELIEENKRLKEELAKAPVSPKNTIHEMDQKQLDMADAYESALQDILSGFQNNDFDYFKTRMLHLKDNYLDVFEKMCKNLDIEPEFLDE